MHVTAPGLTGNFYVDVLRKSPAFHARTPCRDINMLEPVTRAAVQAIIAEAASMGVQFRVDETFRSQALQQQYFNARPPKTHLQKVGVHGYGLACDLHMIVDGKFVEDGSKYQLLRYLAEKHGLLCGGDWGTPSAPHSFRDYDHVQRVSLARQNDLFAGRWYPEPDYRPLADLHRTAPTPAKLANGSPMPWLATPVQIAAAIEAEPKVQVA